jgi:linoleoyl-CoA desaturase
MKLKAQLRFVNKDKNLFYATLKKRIDSYFIDNNISKHANGTMILKTVVLLTAYIAPFVYILAFQPAYSVSLLLWFVMGLAVAGIGMSVMHDANHGAYSSNEKINLLLGHTLNLVGGAVVNWKFQHNVLHHTYTNIATHDEDIQDRLILRFSPHSKLKAVHAAQKVYAFFFYGILTLYWVLAKDFVQHELFVRTGVNTNSKLQNALLLGRIIANKLIYFFALIVVPVWFFNIPASEVIVGFLLMHFVAGIILTVVFQLAHTVEGTTHPLANEKGIIENDWAIHQLQTTVNFSRQSKWISWYVGGLNFQVEHHLFSKICHVHYPNIAPIVKETAEEFGLNYLENKTFGQALSSHFKTLERFGRLPALSDAIG